MQALTGVDDVEHQVVSLLHPLIECGEVRRGIEIGAIRTGQQERRHLLLVLWLFDMDDQRPIRFAGEVVGVHQPVDERSEAIVHRTLTTPQIELDTEIFEILLLLGNGNVVIVPPQRQVPGPSVLQVEGGLACPFCFVGIVLAPLDDNRIHLGQIVERDRRLVGIGAGEGGVEVGKVGLPPLQFDDQLADRHTPVTHVNVADNLVTGNAEEPLEALADD